MIDPPRIGVAGVGKKMVSLINHMINEVLDQHGAKPGEEFVLPVLTFGDLQFE